MCSLAYSTCSGCCCCCGGGVGGGGVGGGVLYAKIKNGTPILPTLKRA